MAEEKPKSVKGPKVSPARTVVSLLLLLVVGTVCVIELRAGFGHMLSGKAFKAREKDGEFTDLPFEEARGMLSMSPTEKAVDRGPDMLYHYEWYSLLRPLMGQQCPQLTLVVTKEEKPMAITFTTEILENAAPPENMTPPPAGPEGMSGMGGGGMGGMGMGGDGMPGGMGGGGRKGRPEMEGDAEPSESPATESPAPEQPAPENPATDSETEPAPAETPAP